MISRYPHYRLLDTVPECLYSALSSADSHDADVCRKTAAPVFLTKNGEGDLVVMDIETFNRREKMLRLREALLAVEEDRFAGREGCSSDELDSYLDDVIAQI